MKNLLTIIIVAFLIGVLGLLQIPSIQTRLTQDILNYSLKGQNISVKVGKISGIFPVNFSIDHLAFSDLDGPFLDTLNLSLVWQPWNLFWLSPNVDFLGIETIKALRKPLLPAAAHQSSSVAIKSFQIGQLHWQEQLLATDISGQFEQNSAGFNLEQTRLTLSNGTIIALSVSLEGPQGHILGLGRLPTGENVRFYSPYDIWQDQIRLPSWKIELDKTAIAGEATIYESGEIHLQGAARFHYKTFWQTVDADQWELTFGFKWIPEQKFGLEIKGVQTAENGQYQLKAIGNLEEIEIFDAFYKNDRFDSTLAAPVFWRLFELVPYSSVHLKFAEGAIKLGPMQPQRTLQFDKIALNLLTQETMGGFLSGSGWIDLTDANRRYQLKVRADPLYLSFNKDIFQAIAKAEIKGDQTHLQWQGDIQQGQRIRLHTDGSFQLVSQALIGNMKGNIDISIFSEFLSYNDKLAGQLNIDIKTTGTLDKPIVNGHLDVANGRYENGAIGLALRNIQFGGPIQNSLLKFTHITGEDIFRGRLEGQGTMAFQQGFIPLFNLKGILHEITLANTDELRGIVNGHIRLEGPGTQAKLSGVFDALSFSYTFGQQQTPHRVLKLIEASDQKFEQALLSYANQPQLTFIPMDIKLNLLQPMTINGNGLKSRWLGNIRIDGALNAPNVLGELNLANGKFEFLGKQLKLTVGHMLFDPLYPNDPMIDIRAEREDMELLIYFQVSGRASNPTFSFSSIPPLPTEEILSRLLFNKSLGKVSPAESLQIATSMAIIESGASANVLDQLRNIFGFDAIEFKEVEQDATQQESRQGLGSVRLGKELSDQVSVHLEQGLQGETSNVGVEFKLTPRLSIEAAMGGANATGAGVNWGMRY